MATLYIDGRAYEHSAKLVPFLEHLTMNGFRLHALRIVVSDRPPDAEAQARYRRHHFVLAFDTEQEMKQALADLAVSREASPFRRAMGTDIIGRSHCLSAATDVAPPGRQIVYFDNVHGELVP
jgi:hypothetical protein